MADNQNFAGEKLSCVQCAIRTILPTYLMNNTKVKGRAHLWQCLESKGPICRPAAKHGVFQLQDIYVTQEIFGYKTYFC